MISKHIKQGELLKLEYQIDHAEVIDLKNNSTIQVGHSVVLKVDKNKKTYKILGSSETDPTKGVISYTSPIGEALLGHKLGDVFDVEIGGKSVECEVLDIK